MAEPVMYIVGNADLHMKAGKTAAQCCHSACKVLFDIHYVIRERKEHNSIYTRWWLGSYTKIALKASERQMRKMMKKYDGICRWTYDEGRTGNAPKGSLTTIAFFPMPRENAPKELKELKLL